LLHCFAAEADEAAFAELVRRHGPMVLGVCRRLLGVDADADDAFQAVFLVLVLRARSIRKGDSVGSWLYGVASRVARRARADARRRLAAHRRLPVRAEGIAEAPAGAEALPVLDEELGRLPDKYRAPLVLCYLQGKTHEQAARELGWPAGSMSRRVSRARDLLRRRLVRRGVTLSAGAALTCAVPDALARAATRAGQAAAAAAGAVPAAAAALAKGVIHTMFLSKCKTALVVALALLVLGTGGGLLVHLGWAAPAPQATNDPIRAVRSERAKASPATGEAPQAVGQKGGEKKEAAKGKEGADAKGTIFALSFSPDGKSLAAGRSEKVEIHDTVARKVARQFGPGAVALAYSPDGRTLAAAGAKGDKVARLYDPNTGQEIRALEGHTEAVTSVAFSPDGKLLLTASKDGSAALWDVATGKEVRRLLGNQGEMLSVAVSPDGATMASGGSDGTAVLWDLATGRILAKSKGSEEAVTSLAFAPDAGSLAVASLDKHIRILEVATGKLLMKLEGHKAGVLAVAYAPDGKQLASVGKDDQVVLWDVAAGQPTTLPGKNVRVHAVRFSPDGRLVVFGSGGALRVWDRNQKAYVKPGGQ
jgi:RNA polymerase sigma factor (sigma-70 family)